MAEEGEGQKQGRKCVDERSLAWVGVGARIVAHVTGYVYWLW